MAPQRLVIERWECSAVRRAAEEARWLLLYGRRKTGKTWLLRRCSNWSLYVTVTSEGSCIVEERGGSPRLLSPRQCLEDTVLPALRRPGVVVLDEFQRLPRIHWDSLAAASWDAEASLMLCGSSMAVARTVFERHSPLLGLLLPLHVDIASYEDTLVSLATAGLEPRQAALWAVVARDPWLLRHLAPAGDPAETLAREAHRLEPAARGLIGEVFEEEERQLTRLYDAVLSLLAQGYWSAASLAKKLHEAGLVSKPAPSSVTGVLDVLASMGLVQRLPLWRTRGARRYYRHRSSLLAVLYAAAPLVEEIGLQPSSEEIRSRLGLELGFNIGEMLAAEKNLRQGYSLPGPRDIDVVLLDKKGRAKWGYEVKAGPMTQGEAEELARWLHSLGVENAGVVALAGIRGEARGLAEAIDAQGLLDRAQRLAEKRRQEAATG